MLLVLFLAEFKRHVNT